MTAAPSISRVPPELAPQIWQELRPKIDRVLSRGSGLNTTADHLLSEILTGHSQFWVVHEGDDIIAGIVVSVELHPSQRRTVYVKMAAGRDLDSWVTSLEAVLRDFRDLTGCDGIETTARPGLAKRLKKRGWRRQAERLELP